MNKLMKLQHMPLLVSYFFIKSYIFETVLQQGCLHLSHINSITVATIDKYMTCIP